MNPTSRVSEIGAGSTFGSARAGPFGAQRTARNRTADRLTSPLWQMVIMLKNLR